MSPLVRFQWKPPALYPIVNLTEDNAEKVVDFALLLIESGALILQLRCKQIQHEAIVHYASAIVRARDSLGTQAANCKLIINDDVAACRRSGADGVHLGQVDTCPDEARKHLGSNAIIGFSTHCLEQVILAQDLPVDYLGFGPVFLSPSKSGHAPVVGLSGLKTASSRSGKPLVAIGGIKLEQVESVFSAGAASVAAISALEPLAYSQDHSLQQAFSDVSSARRRHEKTGENTERHV